MSKKVLIISTSLRKNSNSDALAKSFAEGALCRQRGWNRLAHRQKYCVLQRLPCLPKHRSLRYKRRCNRPCRKNENGGCIGVCNADILLYYSIKFHQAEILNNRRHEGMPPYAVPRREWHQTAKFHLISHYVTAFPRGEADCSLRPGGEGGKRRMRASLTVSSHQIQAISGMRLCSLLILTLAQKKHTAQLNRVLFA